MKNYALTGVAGYIAPRHLKAIKETGSRLVAAVDPHDSVGLLDSYFPDAKFFTEIERFDRYLEKLKRQGSEDAVDYVSVCSPNYLHDAHVRLALRSGAHAICEKPLVLNPWNLDLLRELEEEYERKIYTMLQLRIHPSVLELKAKLDAEQQKTKKHVDLTYITSRGNWYHYSWKGDPEKSGGVATNIGIHFFDLLIWLFGEVQRCELYMSESDKMSGFLELENATVNWLLSLDSSDLPERVVENGKTTYRSIMIDDEEVEFSSGFNDLHTRLYEEILQERGFGIEDARPSIQLVNELRNMQPKKITEKVHVKVI